MADKDNISSVIVGDLADYREKISNLAIKTKEKRVIVTEWITGLLIYVTFLTLSKSSSILHTLKSLFVG